MDFDLHKIVRGEIYIISKTYLIPKAFIQYVLHSLTRYLLDLA